MEEQRERTAEDVVFHDGDGNPYFEQADGTIVDADGHEPMFCQECGEPSDSVNEHDICPDCSQEQQAVDAAPASFRDYGLTGEDDGTPLPSDILLNLHPNGELQCITGREQLDTTIEREGSAEAYVVNTGRHMRVTQQNGLLVTADQPDAAREQD